MSYIPFVARNGLIANSTLVVQNATTIFLSVNSSQLTFGNTVITGSDLVVTNSVNTNVFNGANVNANVITATSTLKVGNTILTTSNIAVNGADITTMFPPVARAISGGGLATGGGSLAADRTITVPAAANTDWIGKTDTTKALTTGAIWDAMNATTIAFAATMTPNLASGFDFVINMTGNATLANPTNARAGQRGRIRVNQDATGGRTLAFGANWKWAGGTDGVLSPDGSAVDFIDYDVVSASFIRASISKQWF